MAFTPEDIQELRTLILQILEEESDPIDDATQIAEFAEGDVVPVVRTDDGVNSYKKAPVGLFGSGGGVVVDDHLDRTSKHPVQNKVVTAALDGKQNLLVNSGANQNIKTINGQEILGTGNITIQGGGGDVDIVNDLTTGGTDKALSAEMGKLLGQRTVAISSTIRIPFSFSPRSVVYRGYSQTFTVSAAISRITPTTLRIKDSSTVIAEVQNSRTASAQRTETLNVGSKTYDAEAEVYGMTINDSGVIYARYPIYYGFGADAAAVATDGTGGTADNRYEPTTTAAHTYTRTSAANGVYFFILVPEDIDGLTTFSMGGAPFVMDTLTPTPIGGINYKIYRSGNSYRSGVKLTVKAE